MFISAQRSNDEAFSWDFDTKQTRRFFSPINHILASEIVCECACVRVHVCVCVR